MFTGNSRKELLFLVVFFFILSIVLFSSKEVRAAGGPGENPGVTGENQDSPEDETINNDNDVNNSKKAPDKSNKKSGESPKKEENQQPAEKKKPEDDSKKNQQDKPKGNSKPSEPEKSDKSKQQKASESNSAKSDVKNNKTEESESIPWELQQNKSDSEGKDSFRKLPSLENAKLSAGARKTNPVKISTEKKEGLIPGFHLSFNNKVYKFSDNPIACINGKIFVCGSDPDFKKLFDDMGLTYSWFSYSGKLFIYLRSGSINWITKTKTALIGEREVAVPTMASSSFSADYIPLDSLAVLLGFQVSENANLFEIRPSVHLASEFSEENKTLNILLLSATEIKYEVNYQARPPAIRLKIPRGSYERDIEKLFVEGVQVRVNSKVDADNLYITCEFPPHWKGEVIPTSYKNEVVIRMKPNLMYAYGMKDETMKEFKLIEAGKQVYAQFGTTAPVQYFWSWDKDEGTLYIDVPFCSPASSVKLDGFQSGMIKNMDMTVLKPDGISITRFRIDLKPGAAFMIGPPEKQEGHAFALLIGPADTIPDPTPEVGGYHILTICGSTGDIIVIDPGHGGSDPGACNGKMGLREKDITLDISKRMAEILNKQGWKVYLTRHTDTDLTYPGSPDADELQARSDVANNCNASVFISIHCNASTNSGLSGSSYHWWKSSDKEIARALEGSLGENIGTRDKGTRRDRFYVLSHSKVPSCLVETAFLSNSRDAGLLASATYRQKIAEKLASAISLFFQQKNLARKEIKANTSGE